MLETLLQAAGPEHESVKDMMLWQRGYLTGLLASIMKHDSLTRRDIALRIAALSKKKQRRT